MNTDTGSIINNLTINSTVDLTGNSYKDWDVQLVIKEAVKYVIHKEPMPRDLRNVLHYYGIVDHFYPAGSHEHLALEEDIDIGESSDGDPSRLLRPPESVERALSRGRQVSNGTPEDRVRKKHPGP